MRKPSKRRGKEKTKDEFAERIDYVGSVEQVLSWTVGVRVDHAGLNVNRGRYPCYAKTSEMGGRDVMVCLAVRCSYTQLTEYNMA